MTYLYTAIAMAAALLLAGAAFGQDPGEPYHSLLTPDGRPCCGRSDCSPYPIGAVRLGDRGYELFHKNEWLPVPDDAILPQPSWDADYHACVVEGYGWRGGQPVPRREVRCVILPGMV